MSLIIELNENHVPESIHTETHTYRHILQLEETIDKIKISLKIFDRTRLDVEPISFDFSIRSFVRFL